MKVFSGRLADSMGKAENLALQTAGAEDIDTELIDMFASISDNDRFNVDAEKALSTTIRNRYGNKASWQADKWYVPIPGLRYEGSDIPQLTITVEVYLVAVALVSTRESRLITLVGSIGKPEVITLPMLFLHALLDDDMGRFGIAAIDSRYTTYGIPGTKPVRLPNDFVDDLDDRLKRQSVVSWLRQFGEQGRYVAPLVAGNLLGLLFRDTGKPVSAEGETVTTDTLIQALEAMAYRPAEAREMVKTAVPRLRADMTLEESIRVTLKSGEGGE